MIAKSKVVFHDYLSSESILQYLRHYLHEPEVRLSVFMDPFSAEGGEPSTAEVVVNDVLIAK